MTGFRRFLIALVLVGAPLAAAAVLAQQQQPAPRPAYQPAVPVASQNYGGYGGEYYSPGGGTVAGNRLQGMASVANAAGNYNLSTSAAAINMTQARAQNIDNYRASTTTYFDMRRVNREAQAAERAPRLSESDLVRIAQEGAPKPLAPTQLDPVEGAINWPTALQDDRFESSRALLTKAFAWRANNGSFNEVQLRKVREATDAMMNGLQETIQDVNPMDYMNSKRFIESLAYEARRPAA